MELIDSTANGNGSDKETLYMLGGVALMVFGAGLILSNPFVPTLYVAAWRRQYCSRGNAGHRTLLETACDVRSGLHE